MYSQRKMRGELVTAIAGIVIAIATALTTAGIKYAKQAYERHQKQQELEETHRDIAIHNYTMYESRIILNGNVQDILLEPRARHEVPNFLENDIKYGKKIVVKYTVHVRTTILNDEGIYERIEKNVPGVCSAPFKDSILFTIRQTSSVSNDTFNFVCTASDYS